jgi:hypothetical protein
VHAARTQDWLGGRSPPGPEEPRQLRLCGGAWLALHAGGVLPGASAQTRELMRSSPFWMGVAEMAGLLHTINVQPMLDVAQPRGEGQDVPNVSWDDIGGLGDVRRALDECIVWRFRCVMRRTTIDCCVWCGTC